MQWWWPGPRNQRWTKRFQEKKPKRTTGQDGDMIPRPMYLPSYEGGWQVSVQSKHVWQEEWHQEKIWKCRDNQRAVKAWGFSFLDQMTIHTGVGQHNYSRLTAKKSRWCPVEFSGHRKECEALTAKWKQRDISILHAVMTFWQCENLKDIPNMKSV